MKRCEDSRANEKVKTAARSFSKAVGIRRVQGTVTLTKTAPSVMPLRRFDGHDGLVEQRSWAFKPVSWAPERPVTGVSCKGEHVSGVYWRKCCEGSE